MVSLSLVNCNTVQIEDGEFCGSMGPIGAQCEWWLSKKQEQMSLKEFAIWWNDLKDPKVATRLSTILSIKGSLEKLCTFAPSGTCNEEMRGQIDSMVKQMGTVEHLGK